VEAGLRHSSLVVASPGGTAALAISSPAVFGSGRAMGIVDTWLRNRGSRLSVVVAADTAAAHAAFDTCTSLGHSVPVVMFVTSCEMDHGNALEVDSIPRLRMPDGRREVLEPGMVYELKRTGTEAHPTGAVAPALRQTVDH